MNWLFQPLLCLIAGSSDNQLAKQIEYLKAENQILRKHLGKRLVLEAAEKRLLVKLGQLVGKGIAALLTVCKYETYRNWVRLYDPAYQAKPASAKGKGGRPRTSDEIRELVIKLAKENDWGYTRILGELKKLGITGICRSTVVNILRENELDPKTDPSKGTWADFLKAHTKSLWGCDFFSKHIVTADGIRQCFVLAFLHVNTRRVFLSPCTFKPDHAWMTTQANAFLNFAKEQGLEARLLLRDRDCKFIVDQGKEWDGGFDATLKAAGIDVKRLSIRSPNLNAYIERFVQSIGQECLDKFIIFAQEHFDHVCGEYVEHYHTERPHQTMGNAPLNATSGAASSEGVVKSRERLGGVLRHYYRAA